MYKIVCKKELNSAVTYMEIEAPFVARKAKAGQFIIFRVDEKSERVPLTIAGYDREKGTVSIIFQKVGLSTELIDNMNAAAADIQHYVLPVLNVLVNHYFYLLLYYTAARRRKLTSQKLPLLFGSFQSFSFTRGLLV